MSGLPQDGLVGLAPIEPRSSFGKMPNEQHQTKHDFMGGASYELAIVEFDDQGRCYDRNQMSGVADRLDALELRGQDAILLVFVHGWKHDARTDDDNLSEFRRILAAAVKQEAISSKGGVARPVLGVFVGWRGLSEYGFGDTIASTTFWGRQAAGQRVATGSVRELFGRLRTYRNDRHNDAASTALLEIAGHSFGGMIVFSALAQSLIEAASAPAGRMVPGFADLVLLINPAIEAARYLPIYDLVVSPAFKARGTTQLPIFICVQAENDQPIGRWFPLGNAAYAAIQAKIDALERQCVSRALGFVPPFRTHTLTGPAAANPFVLSPPDIHQKDPFWVVGADKAVVDGHGGIWQRPFKLFLASILFKHIDDPKGGHGSGPEAGAAPQGYTEDPHERLHPAGGNLADLARTLEDLYPE